MIFLEENYYVTGSYISWHLRCVTHFRVQFFMATIQAPSFVSE